MEKIERKTLWGWRNSGIEFVLVDSDHLW